MILPYSEALASRLCGVTQVQGIEPIDIVRGLPRGRDEVAFETWKASHGVLSEPWLLSWLTLAELEAEDWENFIRRYTVTPRWGEVIARLRELAKQTSADDLRLIIWFTENR